MIWAVLKLLINRGRWITASPISKWTTIAQFLYLLESVGPKDLSCECLFIYLFFQIDLSFFFLSVNSALNSKQSRFESTDRKSENWWNRPEDDIMELLWQNGQVIVQSQNQRSVGKSSPPSKYDAELPPDTEIRSSQAQQVHEHHHDQQQQQQHQQHLFMQEDEMASWLHYPLVGDPALDHNFSADLLYPPPSVTTTTTAATTTTTNSATPIRHAHFQDVRPPTTVAAAQTPASRPPVPQARTELEANVQNFGHFSSQNKARVEAVGPSSSKSGAVRESTTVVDSCDTPAVGWSSRFCEIGRRSPGETSGGGFLAKEAMGCEGTMISSPGDSSASAEPPPPAAKLPAENRKRKGIEADDVECQSEVSWFHYRVLNSDRSVSFSLFSAFPDMLLVCLPPSANVFGGCGVDKRVASPTQPPLGFLHIVRSCALPFSSVHVSLLASVGFVTWGEFNRWWLVDAINCKEPDVQDSNSERLFIYGIDGAYYGTTAFLVLFPCVYICVYILYIYFFFPFLVVLWRNFSFLFCFLFFKRRVSFYLDGIGCSIWK